MSAMSFWDKVQLMLDGIGMIPGWGEPADGLNAIICLARGDTAGAALSGAAMIPFVGNVATAGKLAKKSEKMVTLYHGTNQTGLKKLLPQGAGSTVGASDEVGKVFLTPSPDVAAGYARLRVDDYGGIETIYQVEVPVSRLSLYQPKYYKPSIPELTVNGAVDIVAEGRAPVALLPLLK